MPNDTQVSHKSFGGPHPAPVPGSEQLGVNGEDTGITRKAALPGTAGPQGVEHSDRRIETRSSIDVPSELNGHVSPKNLSAKGAG